MNSNEKWVNEIKKRVENSTPSPPANFWDKIEKDITPIKRVVWYRYALASAVAAAAVVLLFNPTTTSHIVQNTNIKEIQEEIKSNNKITAEKIATKEKSSTKSIKTTKNYNSAKDIEVIDITEATKHKVDSSKTVLTPTTNSSQATSSNKSQKSNQSNKITIEEFLKEESKQKTTKSGLLIALSGGSNGVASTNVEKYSPYRIFSDPSCTSIDVSNPTGLKGYSAHDLDEYSHNQPLQFTISIAMPITKEISIESGINYKFLKSKINGNSSTQALHYLGLPLKANYSFINRESFGAYISAGGLIEKCIYGTHKGEKINIKGVDFSIMGAAGAEYKFTKQVRLFIEPGFSLYLNGGKEYVETTKGKRIKTINRENPLGFSLNGGLRFLIK